MTDPRNPLVPLRHERLCYKSNWRRRHGIPDSPQAISVFGHVRRLPEATPAHSALRLAVGLTSTTLGGSRMTASLGGRYDPSLVKRCGPVSE